MIRVGIAIVLVAVLAAAAGPSLTPYDPASQTLAQRLEPPSRSHPLGLDELGRDILARLLTGARTDNKANAMLRHFDFYGRFAIDHAAAEFEPFQLTDPRIIEFKD